jgi:hypothetical protein
MTDSLIAAARFLSAQLPWLRHATDQHGQPVAADVFREIGDCAARMRSLVDGPTPGKFLGPCRATIAWDDDGNEIPRDTPCAGDVYAYPGAEEGACRACKARWPVDKRRAWLDDEVRQRSFRAAHIAEAYGVSVDTIRSWATAREEIRDRNGKITQYARPARLQAHDHDTKGRPRYLVGDVLDLAAEDAARKETARARRAARVAA